MKAATQGDSRIKPKVTSSLLEHSDYIERAKEVVLLNKDLDIAIPKVKPVSATTIVEELGLQRQLSRWQQLQELFFEV